MTTAETCPLEVDVATANAMRARGDDLVVLDVREGWEVDICSLQPCIHIPLGALPHALDRLPRDRALIVLCHHGRRSLQATSYLRHVGFARASSLEGGVDAWAREIDPAMPRY